MVDWLGKNHQSLLEGNHVVFILVLFLKTHGYGLSVRVVACFSQKGVPPVLWQHQRKVWDILFVVFIRALEATFSNGLIYIMQFLNRPAIPDQR